MDYPDRHPSTQAVVKWFDYDHLSGKAREASLHCHDLAEAMLVMANDSPELTHALRQLLSAKDAFVRAVLEN